MKGFGDEIPKQVWAAAQNVFFLMNGCDTFIIALHVEKDKHREKRCLLIIVR